MHTAANAGHFGVSCGPWPHAQPFCSKHQGASVLVIGRNHHHKPDDFAQWQSAFPAISISYQTVHASKGREADFVLICQVNNGSFPTSVRQEALVDALLTEESGIEYAEERRLFYVALTRAKQSVWILSDSQNPSPFVHELIEGEYPVINKLGRKVACNPVNEPVVIEQDNAERQEDG